MRKMPRCYYCKCPLDWGNPHGAHGPTRDHKIPRARGGQGGTNLVLSCRRCNEEKDNLTVDEYGAWIEAGRPPMYEFKWSLDHFRQFYERQGARPPQPRTMAPDATSTQPEREGGAGC
jgi:hypothetical protein